MLVAARSRASPASFAKDPSATLGDLPQAVADEEAVGDEAIGEAMGFRLSWSHPLATTLKETSRCIHNADALYTKYPPTISLGFDPSPDVELMSQICFSCSDSGRRASREEEGHREDGWCTEGVG
jgi:hypothetical protein